MYFKAGLATTLAHLPETDERRAVTPDVVSQILLSAAGRLRRNIPHFQSKFVAPSEALVDELEARAKS